MKGHLALTNSTISIKKKHKIQKRKIENEIEAAQKQIEALSIEIQKKNDENMELRDRL